MASDKRNGQGPNRRRAGAGRIGRAPILSGLERLERRTLLTTSPTALDPLASIQGGLSSLVATPFATDVTPPRINGVNTNGRSVIIQFSEAMDPSTINSSNVALLRGTDGADLVLFPGAGLTYDASKQQAIINLSALAQTDLPTSTYTAVVNGNVTDAAGNHLDGLYQGYYPSGNGVAGTPFYASLGTVSASNPTGAVTLTAPTVTGLTIAPGSDSGEPGDENTNAQHPVFQGTVTANFPQQVAGVLVAVQFSGYQANNQTTLTVGPLVNGRTRGYAGTPDLLVMTDANGFFSFQAPASLPDGAQSVRVVVVGQNDQPNAAPNTGLSSQSSLSFRVDTTSPLIAAASLANGQSIHSLPSLSLTVIDPVRPFALGSPLAVPSTLNYPALDPVTADNIGNYALINLGPDGVAGTGDDIDESSFILTSTFVDTTARAVTNAPYTGRIDLTFAPGLPSGKYEFIAKGAGGGGPFGLANAPGLADEAGNALSQIPQGSPTQNYVTTFVLQNTPVYVVDYSAYSYDATGRYDTNGADGSLLYDPTAVTVGSGPRAFYEIPNAATEPQARADAPPHGVVITFSSELDPATVSNGTIQLLYSRDGAFDGAGASVMVVPETTVTLASSVAGSHTGQFGFNDRLILNTNLAFLDSHPGHYRVSMSNTGATALKDIYGQVLDGEFLGSPTNSGSYQTLQPDGSYRPGYTGDGSAGGAFQTGFLVAPTGNILFARADYTQYSVTIPDSSNWPANSPTYPNGSYTQPFQVLAPQATTTVRNGGDLNNPLTNTYDPNQDRAHIGRFAPSAIYAAQVASANGPVVIRALPSMQYNPTKSFVLNLPAKVVNGTTLDGSASLPYNTTLDLEAGAVVRLYNATLFAQNQGTAIQANGSFNHPVVFTSYNDPAYVDPSVDGAGTGQAPVGGDWGGVVFRNFDQQGGNNGTTLRPDRFPIDNILKGSNGTPARVGEDDALSALNFANLAYGGGPVPQSLGKTVAYDVISLFNGRPSLTNLTISNSAPSIANAGATVAQAAIGADLDSFREDATARGPLIRGLVFTNNSINGVLLRAEANGVVEQTNAVLYANNPVGDGGLANFTFSSPVPYVLASNFHLGTMFLFDSGNTEVYFPNRVYIQPGMLFKFENGAGIDVDPLDGSRTYWAGEIQGVPTAFNRPTSLNIGDRTYIDGFDGNNLYSPLLPDGVTPNPAFLPEAVAAAQVVFTSFFDINATTFYQDPVTGVKTTIVAANDTANLTLGNTRPVPPGFVPTPGNVPDRARWGGIGIRSGVEAVIDKATFQYGGASINTPSGSIPQRPVLNFDDSLAVVGGGGNLLGGTGQHVMITDNNFYDNTDVPMAIDPNGLLAADPLTPLNSGKPFFRGNVMQRNGINGLGVMNAAGLGVGQALLSAGSSNLQVNSVWDLTDLTYVLRGSIVLDGQVPNAPDATQFTRQLTPRVTLTIQSALPSTVLANGGRIAVPGESTIVKLLNGSGDASANTTPPVPAFDGNLTANTGAGVNGGAGFLIGVDDGVDPPSAPLVDSGVGSQLRIIGIGGNESTGQSRVPVILTSLNDDSAGTTVRGVEMNHAITGSTTGPAAGDGGIIYVGGNAAYTYNVFDPRQGNRIDNADLRYLTRVEYQDGGIMDTRTDVLNPNPVVLQQDLYGNTPLTQNNAMRASAIVDSNFASFRDAALFEHPGFGAIARTVTVNPDNSVSVGPYTRLGLAPLSREGGMLYAANNTFSNIPVGIQINGDITSSDLVAIYNTFYNVPTGIFGNASVAGSIAGSILAMDNIFSGSTVAAINTGLSGVSQAQYNLFQNSPIPTSLPVSPLPPITGDPQFINPGAGNFNLNEYGPNGSPSAAIDAARSELGGYFGGLLSPISTQATLTPGVATPLDPSGISIRNNHIRGLAAGDDGNLVALGGLVGRSFADQFVAVPKGTLGAVPIPTDPANPTSNAATQYYLYVPGERDQRGYLRQDDPNLPDIGFGHQIFYDLGAFEFRQLFAPTVTNVFATNAANPGGVDLYKAGGISGTNQTPTSIRITFDKPLDPATINPLNVLLEASGGTGNFTLPIFINLAGRLAFDSLTNNLVIDTTGLTLPSDEYRVVLKGVGANVIRDGLGNALDGSNLDPANPDPNTNQLPLPSGTGQPGSDFSVTFTIDTTAPQVVAGTFTLAPQSDTSGGFNITSNTLPTFVGRVTDVFPPANPLLGLTVILDIAVNSAAGFNYIQAGVATTDAQGNFAVTDTIPLPDTPYNVGPDGFLPRPYQADNTNYSIARVRVFDQAGNMSTFNDPSSLTQFYVDTTPPAITATSPTIGALTSPTSSAITVTLNTSENIVPSSLTASSITLVGPAGSTPVLDPSSISINRLFTPGGAEQISLSFSGATVNGAYGVFLATSGPNAVRDYAGNTLTPNDAGGYLLWFNVQSAVNNRILYVDASNGSDAGTGARNSPFLTINEGIAAARQGDTVAVLPGLYQERITLKSLVQVVSAASTSTSTSVVPGNALKTIIMPNPIAASYQAVVTGTNLDSISLAPTVLKGFTIATYTNTAIVPGSYGLALINAQVLVDGNYFLDNDIAIADTPYAGGHPNATIQNNVIAGNNVGLAVFARAFTAGSSAIYVLNNDFVFNQLGLYNEVNNTSAISLNVSNDIFWQNDRPGSGGFAIQATAENKTYIQNTLFSFNNNGSANQTGATPGVGTGLGFNPATLSSTPSALGNLSSTATIFVAPVDPRPNNGQNTGLANFFNSANYDLRAGSPAIGGANNAFAPATDLLGRLRIKGPNGTTPTDIGAFEYQRPASTSGSTSGNTGSSGLQPTLPVTTFAVTSPAAVIAPAATAPAATTPAASSTPAPSSTPPPSSGFASSLPTTAAPLPAVVTGVAHPNARQALLQARSQARQAAHLKAVAAAQARAQARAAMIARAHAQTIARRA